MKDKLIKQRINERNRATDHQMALIKQIQIDKLVSVI